jgi:hypothetical protein
MYVRCWFITSYDSVYVLKVLALIILLLMQDLYDLFICKFVM